jgi:hypothetical protein
MNLIKTFILSSNGEQRGAWDFRQSTWPFARVPNGEDQLSCWKPPGSILCVPLIIHNIDQHIQNSMEKLCVVYLFTRHQITAIKWVAKGPIERWCARIDYHVQHKAWPALGTGCHSRFLLLYAPHLHSPTTDFNQRVWKKLQTVETSCHPFQLIQLMAALGKVENEVMFSVPDNTMSSDLDLYPQWWDCRQE